MGERLMTIEDLASRIVVITVVAFGLWVVLLLTLRRLTHPLDGLVAAGLSWLGASVVTGWIVEFLQRAGFWPLV
jgi:hypothetical protein